MLIANLLFAPRCSPQVLIADFFFILFALAWLGAALAERSALQSTVSLHAHANAAVAPRMLPCRMCRALQPMVMLYGWPHNGI